MLGVEKRWLMGTTAGNIAAFDSSEPEGVTLTWARFSVTSASIQEENLESSGVVGRKPAKA